MNEFVVTVDSSKKNVFIDDLKIIINGKEYFYELLEKNAHSYLIRLNEKLYTITKTSTSSNPMEILVEGQYYCTHVRTRIEEKAAAIAENTEKMHHRSATLSPMPGLVLKIKKQIGDEVAMGESVIILEAMKMENDVKSSFSGRITEISVQEKHAVEKGALLFKVE